MRCACLQTAVVYTQQHQARWYDASMSRANPKLVSGGNIAAGQEVVGVQALEPVLWKLCVIDVHSFGPRHPWSTSLRVEVDSEAGIYEVEPVAESQQ